MDDSKLDRSQRMEESVELRRSVIAESCQLHYNQSPLKITSSEGVYLIDDLGSKFLDCATRLSNVGHCHPCVVSAGRAAMQTVGVLQNDTHAQQYTEALLKTLPSNFEVCLFTNSGSEANDLALQLARNYTRRKGVAVMEHSFHGSSGLLTQVSPKEFHRLPAGKPDWVTVLPLPDTYRGKYAQDIYAAQKYFDDTKAAIQRGVAAGGEIACFLSEPVFMVQGMILPPPGWLANLYSYLKSLGTLTIADEVQLGFGRCGTSFWCFQSQDAVPDILTIGKGIANGYPLSAVITSRKIAETIPNFSNHYKCESVAAAVGHAVLRTIFDEDLVERGLRSMDYMYDKFQQLKNKHYFVGDVRKLGLIVGMDIVWNKESKKPDARLAEKISYRLKDNNIIVAAEGNAKNMLIFMPPFCITTHDIDFLISSIARVLTEIEVESSSSVYDEIFASEPSTSTSAHMAVAFTGSSFAMEEQSSPEASIEYSYSDDEARREAEAYADMD